MGLCEGRHNITQVKDGYIFPSVVNPTNLDSMKELISEKLYNVYELNLYVTGLTVALVEVINYCHARNIKLTLYHFDRESGEYYPQEVL